MKIGSTSITDIKVGSTQITKVIRNGVTYWEVDSSWTPQSLGTKVLFWGVVAEETGGHQPNKIDNGTTYLTINTSPKYYTCPNNDDFLAADTDKIWFKLSDNSLRNVYERHLVGYDFTRTFVKYNDLTLAIEEELILKSGAVLTQLELDHIHLYFNLSIWWGGTLNLNGVVKVNRKTAQLAWSSAIVFPTDIANLVLYDVADYEVTTTGLGVSLQGDQSPANNDSIQATDARRPTVIANTIGGKKVLRVRSATQQFLALSSPITLTDFTIFSVTKYNSTYSANNYLLGKSDATNTYFGTAASVIGWRASATLVNLSVPTLSNGDVTLDILKRSSGSVNGYRKGVAASNNPLSNANSAIYNQRFRVSADSFNGNVDEGCILVYSRCLTLTEIAQVEAFLKSYYSITY